MVLDFPLVLVVLEVQSLLVDRLVLELLCLLLVLLVPFLLQVPSLLLDLLVLFLPLGLSIHMVLDLQLVP